MDAKKISLSELPENAITEAFGSDAGFIRREIESGSCALWRLNRGQVYMVTRGEGAECVIVALEGVGLHDVAPDIIASVKRSGFESIRFHSKRPALCRMLKRYGFQERERVYELSLGGEHGRTF